MASTVLAVDDSVTMRKVLEITFAGPDFRVVTASSPDEALQKLRAEKPAVVVADVTLSPQSGYELCKSIKQAAPGTPVLLLSSKQNPYDAGKGSAAQADDHMDKPFDTTQLIDKVKKLASEGRPGVAAAAPAAAPPAARAPVAAASPSPPAAVAKPPVAAAPPPTANAGTPARAKTLIYSPAGGTPAATPPAIAAKTPEPLASPTPVSGVPLQQRSVATTTAVSAMSPAAGAAATASHVNGQMASKLAEMGLTPAQIDGVLALSRDVLERVVWEVVPVLAETIIKEEISRLTK